MAGIKIFQTGGDKDLIETRLWERELAALNLGESKAIKMVNAILDETPANTTIEIRSRNKDEDRWDIVYKREGLKGARPIAPAAIPAANVPQAPLQTDLTEIPAAPATVPAGTVPPIKYPKATKPKTTRGAARVVHITSARHRPKEGSPTDGDK